MNKIGFVRHLKAAKAVGKNNITRGVSISEEDKICWAKKGSEILQEMGIYLSDGIIGVSTSMQRSEDSLNIMFPIIENIVERPELALYHQEEIEDEPYGFGGPGDIISYMAGEVLLGNSLKNYTPLARNASLGYLVVLDDFMKNKMGNSNFIGATHGCNEELHMFEIANMLNNPEKNKILDFFKKHGAYAKGEFVGLYENTGNGLRLNLPKMDVIDISSKVVEELAQQYIAEMRESAKQDSMMLYK